MALVEVPSVEGYWREFAACRDEDPRLFFAQFGRPLEEAIRICGNCPVRDECGQWADETNQQSGVWGGRFYGLDNLRRRCIAAIRDWYEETGKVPGKNEFYINKTFGRLPSRKMVDKIFGGIAAAQAAAFEPDWKVRFWWKQLEELFLVHGQKLSQRKIKVAAKAGNAPDIATVYRYFGEPKSVLQQLGVCRVRRVDWTDEELSEEVRRVTARLCRAPSAGELDSECSVRRQTLVRRFGVQAKILEKTGALELCRQNGWPTT